MLIKSIFSFKEHSKSPEAGSGTDKSFSLMHGKVSCNKSSRCGFKNPLSLQQMHSVAVQLTLGAFNMMQMYSYMICQYAQSTIHPKKKSACDSASAVECTRLNSFLPQFCVHLYANFFKWQGYLHVVTLWFQCITCICNWLHSQNETGLIFLLNLYIRFYKFG